MCTCLFPIRWQGSFIGSILFCICFPVSMKISENYIISTQSQSLHNLHFLNAQRTFRCKHNSGRRFTIYLETRKRINMEEALKHKPLLPNTLTWYCRISQLLPLRCPSGHLTPTPGTPVYIVFFLLDNTMSAESVFSYSFLFCFVFYIYFQIIPCRNNYPLTT